MASSYDFNHVHCVYGTARVRSRVHAQLFPVIFKWLGDMRAVVCLYGKRAWNMYIDPLLRDATKDVDALVCGTRSVFDAMYAHVTCVLETATMALKAPFHHFVHTHSDGKGRTATFQVCGETLLDLSWREQDDYISIERQTKLMLLPPGHVISVLKTETLFSLLEAETRDPRNWRRDIAFGWLQKYRRLERLGLLKSNAPLVVSESIDLVCASDYLLPVQAACSQACNHQAPVSKQKTTLDGCTQTDTVKEEKEQSDSREVVVASRAFQNPPACTPTSAQSRRDASVGTDPCKTRDQSTQSPSRPKMCSVGVQGPSRNTFVDLVLCSALTLREKDAVGMWVPTLHEIETWKREHEQSLTQC